MYPPPAIHPSELRPGRGWYGFAVVFAIVMIVLGVGVFAWGLVTAVQSSDLGARFLPGQPVVVSMAPAPRRAIYVQLDDPKGLTPQADCQIHGPGAASLSLPAGTFTTTRGGASWREMYAVNVTQAGNYQVVCSSGQAQAFAIGRHVSLSTFFGGLLGGLAALFVLPGIGVLVAVITTVVVAVKRGNDRRRLIAERYPPRY